MSNHEILQMLAIGIVYIVSLLVSYGMGVMSERDKFLINYIKHSDRRKQ